MKSSRTLGILLALTSAVVVSGCATVAPQDLVTARTAYERASKGPAARLDPADLHVARQQLDAAEASFAKDGDTQETRDQAYLAVRRSEMAEVVARTMESSENKSRVETAMQKDQKNTVALTSAELNRTKAQLDAQGTAMQVQGAALLEEKARREDAEKRALQAQADLAKFATVKQETRGMVITLSGSVLFASAKWDLLPSAQVKLNDVATALIKEDPLSKMVVEGHTDSQGSESYNLDLGQHRAQAVRDYLVTRGIAADRISAQGIGLSRPIADNKSPEGRANNRRVEIVVLPATPTPQPASATHAP
jgi:outer membrane protein OmpA-like peptidoglycan-associated protein